MKMGEISLDALGLTEEHAATMDDLVPGWRELTLAEFADRLPEAASGLRQQSLAMQRTLDDLEGGDR